MKKAVVIFIIFIGLLAGALAFSLKNKSEHQNQVTTIKNTAKD
ncbi:hypothetical protein ELUMI_v1c05980 [Williamsoniiplasma luminosum]|uniref:Uncharacterized protein n=1 Tax=Williamsoniiplasma luminosum TaxID=214888 RepID=A0A2K8NU02_9MOLU|nr:hypothetical protein [Williamsoniiplasma luminosum]ATZ17320.1 hypothetical protein ELUMI_v1c05980 [Williamsoniiplasma luminosum]